jgi:hypothetical protein
MPLDLIVKRERVIDPVQEIDAVMAPHWAWAQTRPLEARRWSWGTPPREPHVAEYDWQADRSSE